MTQPEEIRISKSVCFCCIIEILQFCLIPARPVNNDEATEPENDENSSSSLTKGKSKKAIYLSFEPPFDLLGHQIRYVHAHKVHDASILAMRNSQFLRKNEQW